MEQRIVHKLEPYGRISCSGRRPCSSEITSQFDVFVTCPSCIDPSIKKNPTTKIKTRSVGACLDSRPLSPRGQISQGFHPSGITSLPRDSATDSYPPRTRESRGFSSPKIEQKSVRTLAAYSTHLVYVHCRKLYVH